MNRTYCVQQTENSDDSRYEDVWSPSLREDVFSAVDLGPATGSSDPLHYSTHSPLPRPFYSQPIPLLSHPPSQQERGHNTHPSVSTSLHGPSSVPLSRKRSHLDPPNFPLQSDPVGNNSNTNTSGRPQTATTFRSRPTTPLSRDLPRPFTPLSEDFWSTSGTSSRSDTPWPEQSDDFSDFVDLTADSSPPAMPPTKRPRLIQRILTTRDTSSAPSNPHKRRKTEATHSGDRSQLIEEIDLRDIDDDQGLSKVLEQQRMATVKAQQEQANRPVKLSTLQCIICMEPMKDLTATHCGHLFCHSCLMEALIAGENQGPEPGKGTPKCPVCRKKVLRPTERKDHRNFVPLSMKVKAKVSLGKGKAKAA